MATQLGIPPVLDKSANTGILNPFVKITEFFAKPPIKGGPAVKITEFFAKPPIKGGPAIPNPDLPKPQPKPLPWTYKPEPGTTKATENKSKKSPANSKVFVSKRIVTDLVPVTNVKLSRLGSGRLPNFESTTPGSGDLTMRCAWNVPTNLVNPRYKVKVYLYRSSDNLEIARSADLVPAASMTWEKNVFDSFTNFLNTANARLYFKVVLTDTQGLSQSSTYTSPTIGTRIVDPASLFKLPKSSWFGIVKDYVWGESTRYIPSFILRASLNTRDRVNVTILRYYTYQITTASYKHLLSAFDALFSGNENKNKTFITVNGLNNTTPVTVVLPATTGLKRSSSTTDCTANPAFAGSSAGVKVPLSTSYYDLDQKPVTKYMTRIKNVVISNSDFMSSDANTKTNFVMDDDRPDRTDYVAPTPTAKPPSVSVATVKQIDSLSTVATSSAPKPTTLAAIVDKTTVTTKNVTPPIVAPTKVAVAPSNVAVVAPVKVAQPSAQPAPVPVVTKTPISSTVTRRLTPVYEDAPTTTRVSSVEAIVASPMRVVERVTAPVDVVAPKPRVTSTLAARMDII